MWLHKNGFTHIYICRRVAVAIQHGFPEIKLANSNLAKMQLALVEIIVGCRIMVVKGPVCEALSKVMVY